METTGPPDGPGLRPSPRSSSRFNAYLSLIRVPNCLMIGFAVFIGETIALGNLPSLTQAVFGVLTASLLLAGTMVLNDIQDIEADRVNSPHRALPSGKVSIAEAYALSIVLSGLGMVSALSLGVFPFLTALLALALMVFYNLRGKKTGILGNGVVSFNVALPFLFGGIVIGNNIRPLLLIFFLLAFLANTAREVAKGIFDVAGDRTEGIKTIAVSRGERVAARVTATLFAFAVVLSFIPPLLDKVSFFYYPGVISADIGFVYSSSRLLRDPSPKAAKSVKTQVLLWMLLGLVGFLLGGSALI